MVRVSKAIIRGMGSLEKIRRMATVIQDSNDAITFQNLEGHILAWNRGAEFMYGYSESEALSMNIVDTVPTDYQEEARAFLASLKRGELVPNLETKRKTKDGRIIDVWLTNTKLTDDKGKLTGIATTERDISEMKKSESRLRDKFRELEYLREGQIALSESMRGEQAISCLGHSILSHLIPFTNAQVGAFYSVIEDKKLQQVSTYALAHNNDKYIISFGEGLVGQVALEKKILLIDDVPAEYFRKIKSGLGQLIPRSLLIFPILYENQVTGVIELGSLRPFTEHQRIFLSHVSENIGIAMNTSEVRKKVQKQNEALNEAQVLLEEKANEVQRASLYKTAFLANMSHELRTPLGAILGFLDLLKNPHCSTEEKNKYMVIVERNSQQLLSLIDDILDLSKVESGKMSVENIQFSLSDMLADFTSSMVFRAKEKGIEFTFNTETLIPDIISSDPVRLRQVLSNIVGNALKFTIRGGVILTVSYVDEILKFTVKDTGVGISKDQESKLFQPFTQANASTTRKFGGTGLGLALSRRLAQALGGGLTLLESQEGVGSTFVIEIKSILVPEAQFVAKEKLTILSAQSIDKSLIRHSLLGLKVLLVEDSADNQMLIRMYLSHAGASTTFAFDGAEGVEMALMGDYDVILMDIQMPVLDGHEATQKLRSLSYNKPIVALTAHAMKEEREKCLESGFTDFLTKPIQKDLLFEVLSRYVKV